MSDETAMLLTQQEWSDLSVMMNHFKLATAWLEVERQRRVAEERDLEHVQMLDRCRRLADRIIDAERL